MKALFLPILITLFLHSCAVRKKIIPPPGIGDYLTQRMVMIYNRTATEKVFQIKYVNKLDTIKVKPNEIWESPDYMQKPIFEIKTDHKTVSYTLNLGTSYVIYWNSNKMHWDLMKISKTELGNAL